MTPQAFYTFWQQSYPGCPPINHLFKWRFQERWMRIHSLPDAQRYPADEADWETLLARQNQLCQDLLGEGGEFLLVGGDFLNTSEGGYGIEGPLAEEPALADVTFQVGARIDLHRALPERYAPGLHYDALFSPQTWQHGRWDQVLRGLAEDELWVFFVSIANQCIVAPYDGGVDVILADSATRDACKARYAAWLSTRPDGY